MSIIGIIANERQTNQIKKEIDNLKVEVICINSESIENIKNVKFEIIVIQDTIEKLNEKQQYIRELIKNTKYLLLNTDIIISEEIFKDINVRILTYGLKRKATITATSIEENKSIISIQRAFKNTEENIVEQQEIPVRLTKNGTKYLYNSLIKITIINILEGKNR